METIQQLKEKFISETKSVMSDFNKLKSLSENQINWKLSLENWSIAECIDHLVVTNKLYLKDFENQFSAKLIKTDCSKTVVKHKWLSKYIIKAVSPYTTKNTKTFAVFMPSKSRLSKAVFVDFEVVQTKLINLVSSAVNLDLNQYVMSSPVAKIIKENYCDVLEIIHLHDRRHFNQAERLFNHPNFPQN